MVVNPLMIGAIVTLVSVAITAVSFSMMATRINNNSLLDNKNPFGAINVFALMLGQIGIVGGVTTMIIGGIMMILEGI